MRFEKEINDKENKINELNTEIKTLTATNSQLIDKNNNLESEIESLKEQINNLESENESLKNFKADVEEKIPGLANNENNTTIVIEKNNLNNKNTITVQNTVNTGYKKYKVSQNFTDYVGEEVQKQLGGTWTCIAGYQFYDYIYSVKYYIRFTIGQMSVILLGN